MGYSLVLLLQNFPNLPNWEYIGALTLALIIVVLFVRGTIVTGTSSDERSSAGEQRAVHWRELSQSLSKENSHLSRQVTETSEIHNRNLSEVLDILKSIQHDIKELRTETRNISQISHQQRGYNNPSSGPSYYRGVEEENERQ